MTEDPSDRTAADSEQEDEDLFVSQHRNNPFVGSRLVTKVQLTIDGFISYLEAVVDTFGSQVDYARLIKINHNRGYLWQP